MEGEEMIKYDDYTYYACIKCGEYVVLPKGLYYHIPEDREKMICGLCELEEIGEDTLKLKGE